MKPIVSVLCFIVFSFCSNQSLVSDEVYLEDGRVLKGIIIDRGEDQIEVKMDLGSMLVNRKKIIKMVTSEAPIKVFEEKYKSIDKNDPKALMALAAWCKEQGVFKYEELMNKAKELLLKQKIQEAGHDPDALYQVTFWAKENRLPQETIQNLLKRVIGLNPDHAGARKDMGQVQYKGMWIDVEEAKRLEARDFEASMREKGFVFFDGKWVRPEEAQWATQIETLKNDIEKMKKERDDAKSSLVPLERENEDLKRLKSDLESVIDRQQRQLSYLSLYTSCMETIKGTAQVLDRALDHAPPEVSMRYIEQLKNLVHSILSVIYKVESDHR